MTATERTALDQALCAVMDGRATPQQWEHVEAAWARDPSLREQWTVWQTAADGLRSADLLAHRVGTVDLLERLHGALPVRLPTARPRREWLAPFAVAAGFFAMAVGVTQLRPEAPTDTVLTAAPFETVPMRGLVGTSFAQTAAGRTLAPGVSGRDSVMLSEPALEGLDWPSPAAEGAASGPRP
jgi:negative regulator of sigma E activity